MRTETGWAVVRNAEAIEVAIVLDPRPSFPAVPEPPEAYDASVGWSTLVRGPARVEYHGRVYETYYTKQVKSGVAYAIELYYFDTPPDGKHVALVNGERLQNRFLRGPAADHPDQSQASWRLYHFEYHKGEWQFHDTPNRKVRVLSQPGR